ncbi:MAG TPA: glycosyltransferase family 4 protein [Candidatus Paceibacterota bacterium]
MIYTRINNKVSVVMFLPTFSPLPMGGSEIQTKLLVNELLKNDKLFIITPNNNFLPSYEIIDGIPVYRFKIIRKKSKKKEQSPTVNYINDPVIFDYSDQKGIDLLYAPTKLTLKQILGQINIFICALYYFWKLRKEYNIIQINTVTFYAVIVALIGKILNKSVIIKDSTMDGVQKMSSTPFQKVSRRFITQNCTFVAMTKAIENNYIKASIPKNRIIRIPNGIDVKYIPKRKSDFEYKCLFVGNLYQQPAKGIDILIKAWQIVYTKFPQAKLTIVGDGNITAYKNHIYDLGLANSIIFTGKSQPKEYYLTNDIFILPSRREGMSNALLEAMHYQMTIIATDISGNQDLIKNNYSGILIPSNNVEYLTTAIDYLFNNQDLAIEMGKKAYQKVIKLYNIKKIANSYHDLYLKLNFDKNK